MARWANAAALIDFAAVTHDAANSNPVLGRIERPRGLQVHRDASDVAGTNVRTSSKIFVDRHESE